MKFSDIPGHEEAKARLRAMADSGRIPHALLIHGPEGIGKMSLARAFAQYVHCEHREMGDSCGRCPSCLQHQSFNHIDTHYVFPVVKKQKSRLTSDDYMAEWREYLAGSPWMDFGRWLAALDNINAQPMIYVEESASLIRKLTYTSHNVRHRIVILWLPERMNAECANKLLKMIEEPYEDTLLVFVSDNAREILPTIYSRMQRIELKRLSDEIVGEYLADTMSVDPQDAMAVAHIAEGNMIAALKAMEVTKESRQFLELFMSLMRLAYQRKVKELRDWSVAVADLGREGESRFLEYCQRLVRENFIYNLQEPKLNYLTRDEVEFSRNFARFITEANVVKLIEQLNRAKMEIASNGNAKIILFDLAIKVILLLKSA